MASDMEMRDFNRSKVRKFEGEVQIAQNRYGLWL